MKLTIRKKYVNVIVLLAALIIGLLAAEATIRVFYPQKLYNRFNTEHPALEHSYYLADIGLLWTPNREYIQYGENNRLISIRINSQGFRNDFDFSGNAGITGGATHKKVAFFGDSFMFGDGIDQDETLPSHVKKMLPEIEAYNFGMPARSFGESFLAYLTRGVQYSPDVVVFSIFTNDIIDDASPGTTLRKPIFTLNNGRLELYQYPASLDEVDWQRQIEEHRRHKYSGIDRILRANSHLYVLIGKFTSATASSAIYTYAAQAPAFQYYLKRPPANILAGENTVCAIVAEANRQVRERNSSAIFIYIPDQIEVVEARRNNALREVAYYSSSDFDYSSVAKFFQECFESHNLTSLNLYYEFEKLDEKEKLQLYNRYGSHWSPKATRTAAAKLAPIIQQKIQEKTNRQD